MLDFSYLLISYLILIVEQETPPLHFWQFADNPLEQSCPFFFKNNLLNAFRLSYRPPVQSFLHNLRKLSVAVIPSLDFPFIKFQSPKRHLKVIWYAQLLDFPLPVPKTDMVTRSVLCYYLPKPV